MLFSGKACFSPSVSRALMKGWVKNGGKLTHTVRDFYEATFFFCNGLDDPWLLKLLERSLIVRHANWIATCIAEQFLMPIAPYTLDDNFDPTAIACLDINQSDESMATKVDSSITMVMQDAEFIAKDSLAGELSSTTIERKMGRYNVKTENDSCADSDDKRATKKIRLDTIGYPSQIPSPLRPSDKTEQESIKVFTGRVPISGPTIGPVIQLPSKNSDQVLLVRSHQTHTGGGLGTTKNPKHLSQAQHRHPKKLIIKPQVGLPSRPRLKPSGSEEAPSRKLTMMMIPSTSTSADGIVSSAAFSSADSSSNPPTTTTTHTTFWAQTRKSYPGSGPLILKLSDVVRAGRHPSFDPKLFTVNGTYGNEEFGCVWS